MNKKKLSERRFDEKLSDEQIEKMIQRRFKTLIALGFKEPFLRECGTVICHGDYIRIDNRIAEEILFLIHIRDCL